MRWRTVGENIPAEALPVLCSQLEQFGCQIVFEEPHAGVLESIAGSLRFKLQDGALLVKVETDHGHFPQAMLIGGMRQFVEEAVELVSKRVTA